MNIKTILCLISLSCASLAFAEDDVNTAGLLLIGSADGSTWSEQVSTTGIYQGIFFGKLTFVQNKIFTSTEIYNPYGYIIDGLAETSDFGKTWNTLGVNPGAKKIAVKLKGSQGPNEIFMPEADGLNWISAGMEESYGFINYSAIDGKYWYSLYPQDQIPSCNQFAYLNDLSFDGKNYAVLASCLGGTSPLPYPQQGILISQDTANWQWQPSFPASVQGSDVSNFNSIRWDGSQWVVLGNDNQNNAVILTSPDLNTWKTYALPTSMTSLSSVFMNKNQWIAVGLGNNSPVILQSLDAGSTWNSETNLPSGWSSINRVNFANSTWVIVGSRVSTGGTSPALAISHDGINWQDEKLPINILLPSAHSTISDVIWTGSQWIAAGNYENNPTPVMVGCDFFNQLNWTGQLTSPSDHANVSGFSFQKEALTKNSYAISGSIHYVDDSGANFGTNNLSGTCTDQSDGSATFSLSGDRYYSISGSHQNAYDATITITQSSLLTSNGQTQNFQGQLAMSSGAKKLKNKG